MIADAIDAVDYAVVRSLLYALAVSPTAQPQSFAGAWAWHMFGPATPSDDDTAVSDWRRVAWQRPAAEPRPVGGGTLLRGSYLSVDIALSDAQLVRLPSAEPPAPHTLDDLAREAIVQSVGIVDDEDMTDVIAQDDWISAMDAGRRQIAAWEDGTARTDMAPALRAASIDEWRANLILWDVRRNAKDPFAALRSTEVFQIGAAGRRLVSWSHSGTAIDGCLCRLATAGLAPEDLRGRPLPALSMVTVDLSVRLAQHLHDLKLPVALATVLWPAAIQDWLEHIEAGWPDDWEAFAAWPRQLTRERVEDYLLYFVANGTLVSPEAKGAREPQ